MNRLIGIAFGFPLIASAIAQTYRTPEVTIEPDPRFPEFTKEESRKLLASAIQATVKLQLEKSGATVADDGKSTLVIKLLRFDCRNRSRDEILTNHAGNTSGSETTVELEFSFNGAPAKKLKGKAPGSYFGTTDRTDMSGSPQDKVMMIRLVGRQKARAIAAATWNAIKGTF